MALIKVGNMNDFSVSAKKKVLKNQPRFKNIATFKELKEISIESEPNSFELITSEEKRGLALKGIKLTKDFEGFLKNVFNPTNEIYFIAWAWDMSGEKVNQYPGENVNAETVLIPLKAGKLREFIGEGINLFPKRKVTGGIAIRIQLWESDDEVRSFGKTLSATTKAIEKSELNQLLSLIATGTVVSGATINLVKNAAIELSKVIGTILQANGDDYVDFFEGYYASDQTWSANDETYNGNASLITLRKY
jgi:hypothetical protein